MTNGTVHHKATTSDLILLAGDPCSLSAFCLARETRFGLYGLATQWRDKLPPGWPWKRPIVLEDPPSTKQRATRAEPCQDGFASHRRTD